MERPTWRICCFGALLASSGDRAIDHFQTQKTGLLFAYLACNTHRRPPREELIEILWPDVELDVGRNRLSQALAWLRPLLEPSGTPKGNILVTDRLSAGLNPGAVACDVGEFQATAKSADKETNPAAQALLLARCVDLYQGPLLPGYYDDWVMTERQRLLDIYLRSLRRLTVAAEQSCDFERAIEYAHRAVATDPLAEELHCELMRVLAASGQPVAALRQFQELERILVKELDLTPSAAARALADQIRQDDRHAVAPSPKKPIPPPAIRAPLNRFFGREIEIRRVKDLLQSGSVRLITLTGVGGAGKTRLALEIASRLAGDYPGAVAVVPLADLRDARLVPAAVADRLQLPRSGDIPVEDQLVRYLSQHQFLLVLDDLEHLIDGSVLFVRDLLERVPSLAILATSQTRLGLDGEREIPLPPLAAPQTSAKDIIPEELMQVASVQLFVDRAQAVRPDFEINLRNAVDIARICDQLEGIPLAIELCAAWAQALSPGQMLAQLDRRFDLLVSRRSDSEARHRSLRAAVEHSYHLISPDLQQFFIRLSVFRGGWTLEASEAAALVVLPMQTEGGNVTVVNQAVPVEAGRQHPGGKVSALDHLMRLRDRSLILTEEAGSEMRCRMLETLRDFARNQCDPEVDYALRRWHAQYFMALAEEAEPQIAGAGQASWLGRLKIEHDNLRAALHWAVDRGEAEIALRLAAALAPFWHARGHLDEGQDWLERVIALPTSPSPGADRTRARALNAWGMLGRNQGHAPKATAALEEALRIWRQLGDENGMAISLQDLATLAYSREDWESARVYLEEGVRLSQKLDDPVLQARAFVNLGNLNLAQSDWQNARANYVEGLKIYRALGDRIGASAVLNNMGLLCLYEADISGAITFLNDSLALARELSGLRGMAVAILNLAHVNRMEGCYDIARSLVQEGASLALEAGERRLLPECLAHFGYVSCAEQKYHLAVTLLSASESLRIEMGISAGPFGMRDLDSATLLAKSVLGDTAFSAAWSEGSRLKFPEAFARAVSNEDT